MRARLLVPLLVLALLALLALLFDTHARRAYDEVPFVSLALGVVVLGVVGMTTLFRAPA